MAAFDPDQWLEQTAPQAAPSAGFDPDQWLAETDDYWGDVKKHAIEGVKEFPAAAGEMAVQSGKIARVMPNLPGEAFKGVSAFIQGKPVGDTPIGQASEAALGFGKGAIEGTWQGVKDAGSLVKSGYQYLADDELPFAETEIGQKFRERPISVPLGVVGTAFGLKGGMKALPKVRSGINALRGKPLIPEGAGAVPEGGIPPEPPPVGAGTPPEGGGIPPTGGASFDPMADVEGFVKKFAERAKPKAQDLGAYINRGYQRAEKAGMLGDIPDLTQEASQLMAVRAVGGNPGYAISARRAGKTPRQISDELRGIGQYVIDEDINRPQLGDSHMINTHERLMEEAGGRIGGIRMMADDLAPPVNYQADIMQTLQNHFGDALVEGPYAEALKVVQKHPPTYQGMAEAATELNKKANLANKNHQPHTPFTEVANVLSPYNNGRIMKVVGPDVAKVYNSALNEYGVNLKIQNFLARKVGQGLHRIGPGTLKRAFVQKFFDEIGYKAGSRVLNRMSSKIKANPGLVKNLPDLFKTFIDEIDDLLPDVESKAFGGIVGEMDAYLTPKYGGNP